VNPRVDPEVDLDSAPPAKQGLRVLAFVLLVIPIVALLWVSSYSKEEPSLGGFPFFFWYQFAWIFVTSGLTWIAYRLVLAARPHRPIRSSRPKVQPEPWRNA
jgi:hypothetical protein